MVYHERAILLQEHMLLFLSLVHQYYFGLGQNFPVRMYLSVRISWESNLLFRQKKFFDSHEIASLLYFYGHIYVPTNVLVRHFYLTTWHLIRHYWIIFMTYLWLKHDWEWAPFWCFEPPKLSSWKGLGRWTIHHNNQPETMLRGRKLGRPRHNEGRSLPSLEDQDEGAIVWGPEDNEADSQREKAVLTMTEHNRPENTKRAYNSKIEE